MKERLHGSSHSLPPSNWTGSAWHALVDELVAVRDAPRRMRYRLPSARRHSWRRARALILQDFAYRFHMAMQEVCPRKRDAMLAQLASEEKAALRHARETSIAETQWRRRRPLPGRADRRPKRPKLRPRRSSTHVPRL
jgi:hypothetical protein